jgi:hypothetical protein
LALPHTPSILFWNPGYATAYLFVVFLLIKYIACCETVCLLNVILPVGDISELYTKFNHRHRLCLALWHTTKLDNNGSKLDQQISINFITRLDSTIQTPKVGESMVSMIVRNSTTYVNHCAKVNHNKNNWSKLFRINKHWDRNEKYSYWCN